MENRKEKNSTWLIVLLILIILGLVGYICYDKFLTKEEPKEPPVVEVDCAKTSLDNGEGKEKPSTEVGCTKFVSSYKLSDKDKEEIIEALYNQNIQGYTKADIDEVINVSQNGYFLTVGIGPELAHVARVDGKLKVNLVGSSVDGDYVNNVLDTVDWLCK